MRPPPTLRDEPVLDRVLDERLQDHARHDHVERVRARSPSRRAAAGRSGRPRCRGTRRSTRAPRAASRSDRWLRSSRRSRPESLAISMRAVSGCDRISDEIDVERVEQEVRVDLARRAPRSRAAISSFSCSWSRCSMRALFQILIGVATHSTVARMTSERHPGELGRQVEEAAARPSGGRAPGGAARGAIGRQQEDDLPVDLERPDASATARRCRLVKTNGEKCQMASFGHSSRRPPPAKPQPTAKGSAIHSPATSGGRPTIDADDARRRTGRR